MSSKHVVSSLEKPLEIMQQASRSPAQKSDIRYFYEDVVYRLRKKGKGLQLGMVVENSEFVSSDEDSSDDEETLKKGTIRVAWHPNGEEQVVKEKAVGLADRSLMPGDVVRRLIRGRETQRGYCRQVNVHASCQIVGTNQVIYGISSHDLVPLEQFTLDVAVCLDEWVGMIRQVKSNITVKFIQPGASQSPRDNPKKSSTEPNTNVIGENNSDDNRYAETMCIVSDIVAEELEDVIDKRDNECEFKRYDFYQ